jgi:hypothetical protein
VFHRSIRQLKSAAETGRGAAVRKPVRVLAAWWGGEVALFVAWLGLQSLMAIGSPPPEILRDLWNR